MCRLERMSTGIPHAGPSPEQKGGSAQSKSGGNECCSDLWRNENIGEWGTDGRQKLPSSCLLEGAQCPLFGVLVKPTSPVSAVGLTSMKSLRTWLPSGLRIVRLAPNREAHTGYWAEEQQGDGKEIPGGAVVPEGDGDAAAGGAEEQDDAASTETRLPLKLNASPVPEATLPTTGDQPNVREGATLGGASPTASTAAPATKTLWRSSTLHGKMDAVTTLALISGYDVGRGHESKTILDSSPTNRLVVGGVSLTFAAVVVFVWNYRRTRRRSRKEAKRLRSAKAGQTISRFVAVVAHRRRTATQAATFLQALARGAAARRCLRCLAQKRDDMRSELAAETIARFVVAVTHRRRTVTQAVVVLQTLARGAAARRCLRCLAQKRDDMRSAIAAETIARFVVAVTHRRRATTQAVVVLQTLARGAAARRCLRCLAQKRDDMRSAIAAETIARFVVAVTHRRRATRKAVVVLQTLARGAAARRLLRCLAQKRADMRSAIAGQTIARFVVTVAHRRRATRKAVVVLQTLARGAAARRLLRCLAQKRAGMRSAIAGQTIAGFVVAVAHRHRAAQKAAMILQALARGAAARAAAHRHRAAKKAAIVLQALARGAAARRLLRCLAQEQTCAILVQTRWRAYAAIRIYRAQKTAAMVWEAFACRAVARHQRVWLQRHAWIVLTRWKAHAATTVAANRQYRVQQSAAVAAIVRKAFTSGGGVKLRTPRRTEASDMAEAASLDVTCGFLDVSAVRDANTTGEPHSAPRPEMKGELRSSTAGETGPETATRSSQEAKRQQWRERNKLKKEARGRSRASKAGHKLPAYSADRFNDRLLMAGRGGASDGVVCGRDSPQGSAKEHGCAAEASPSPPETTGTVVVEAAGKSWRKVEWKKSPDLTRFKFPLIAHQHQDAGSTSVGRSVRGFSGRTPRLGHTGTATGVPPSHMSPGARACAGVPPSHTGPGAGACLSPPQAKIGEAEGGVWSRRTPAAVLSGPTDQAADTRKEVDTDRAPIGTTEDGKRSVRIPATVLSGPSAQIGKGKRSVRASATVPSGPSTKIGKGKRSVRASATVPSGPSTKLPRLTMVNGLFESRKPAILGSNGWFEGAYRLNVDPDGNCFGTAWVVASLIWAVQTRGSLNSFVTKLKKANRPGGAFSVLDIEHRRYTGFFISYVDRLTTEWGGIQPAQEAAHGISLAVGVVRKLRGPTTVGCGLEQGGEPSWLKLKWGIALAARALDVKSAPANLPVADMVKLRRMGESVEFHVGMAHAISTSSTTTGEAADTPVDDAVRPGRGLNLVVGVVMASLAPDGVRPTEGGIDVHTPDRVREEIDRRLRLEDLTGYFRGLTKDRCISGLALVKGATPHYDVLAATGTPLAEALASAFGAEGGEAEALQELKDEIESRRETTQAELKALVSSEVLDAQADLWKQIQQKTARSRASTVRQPRTAAADCLG